ncbi:hypothetical protein ACKF11_08750 [Methylobacillus sp. Pita2]|uniref:hypothetical protein n=1 Tax=Methylobacillus sp. Pita2 TaxID=3383245 RepID=UPI0038B60554
MKYSEHAPNVLVKKYSEVRRFPGKVILGRLLNVEDENMNKAWIALGKHLKSEKDWLELWSWICHAKLKSQKMPRENREDIKRDLLNLSEKLNLLAGKVRKSEDLDVPAYMLLDDDELTILGMEKLHSLHVVDRDSLARNVLHYWPSASGLLEGLAKLAKDKAGKVMSKTGAVRKSIGNPQQREFIVCLGNYFLMARRADGTTMIGQPLNAHLASIANVVFPGEDASERSVRSIIATLKGKNNLVLTSHPSSS